MCFVGERGSNGDDLDTAFQEVLRVRRVHTPGRHELDAREWPKHCGGPVRSDHRRPRFGGLTHSLQGSDRASADGFAESGARRDDGAQCFDVAIGLDWHFDAVDTEAPGDAGDRYATFDAESSQNGHEGMSVEELCE